VSVSGACRERVGSVSGAPSAGMMVLLQSEDEALARAMALSMAAADAPPPDASPLTEEERRRQQEAADAALARALQHSEQEARRHAAATANTRVRSRTGGRGVRG
jgi:hypothetical protein